MKKCNKIPAVILSVVLFSLFLNGCYPDRHPVSPEEYSTRRPKIVYHTPTDEDSVGQAVKVDIWFDDLMNNASVENAFSLAMVVNEEPWNNITTAAAMDQSYSDPQILYRIANKNPKTHPATYTALTI